MEAPKRSSVKSKESQTSIPQESDMQTLVNLTKKNRVKSLRDFWENIGEEPSKKSLGEYPPQLSYEDMSK